MSREDDIGCVPAIGERRKIKKMAAYRFILVLAENGELLKFAVIISKTNGKWVFCKHRERDTYEVPGGHRESGEDILTTARRELREETGAVDFVIRPVCVYSVKGKTEINQGDEDETFGMLFVADIFSFEELHSEIESILITDHLVDNWTYPLIQPDGHFHIKGMESEPALVHGFGIGKPVYITADSLV